MKRLELMDELCISIFAAVGMMQSIFIQIMGFFTFTKVHLTHELSKVYSEQSILDQKWEAQYKEAPNLILMGSVHITIIYCSRLNQFLRIHYYSSCNIPQLTDNNNNFVKLDLGLMLVTIDVSNIEYDACILYQTHSQFKGDKA